MNYFTLYEMLTIDNLIPKIFNVYHHVEFNVKTESSIIHFQVSGDFNPKDINVTDVEVIVSSPAGQLIGHGLTILDAFNDVMKQVQDRIN